MCGVCNRDGSCRTIARIGCKTHQIKEALANLPANLRPAHFITLQNGLGNGEQVAAYVGIEQTVEDVSIMPAEFIKPGEVGSAGSSETWMF